MLSFLPKDRTNIYQKQIQQTLQQNNIITEEHGTKYALQINPVPPQLKSHLRIYKEDIHIQTFVNNAISTAYKLAKFLR